MTNLFKKFIVAAVAVQAFALGIHAQPNPENPLHVMYVYSSCSNCDGNSGEFIFWRQTWRNGSAEIARFKRENLVREKRGIFNVTSFNNFPEIADNIPGGKDYGSYHNEGSQAWAAWTNARQQYWPKDANGNNPLAHNGWISPMMPLDPQDNPPGMTNATYGDFMAYHFADFIVGTGANGMFLSDFLDQIPGGYDLDYNPRVVAAFTAKTGLVVQGNSIPQKAKFIKENYYKEWNDFKCQAYAHTFGSIARRYKQATGKTALIAFQGDGRFYGQDPNMLEDSITAAGGRLMKVNELQGDGQREFHTISYGITSTLDLTSKLPNSWIGVQMSATRKLPVSLDQGDITEPAAYSTEFEMKTVSNPEGTWTGQVPFMTMPEGDRLEFINKYLRAHWLTVAWTHIANRDGTVRRAIQFYHPYYNQQGLVPLDIKDKIMSIYPVHPFGNAFYFSKGTASNFEKQFRVIWSPSFSASGAGAVPVGYGFSTLALDGFAQHPENRPTAIITSDLDQMPAAELAKLKAIAPVYDARDASRILSPIQFSGDVNGYAFVDQNGRTIIVAFRENWKRTKMHLQGTGDITCKISFNGIQNGTYTLTDLYDNSKTYTLNVDKGLGTVDVPMSRWEARAFSSNIPSPNGSYNQPIDKDSLVLHWKLDETGSNAVASDASGSSRIGVMVTNNQIGNWNNNPWDEGKFNGGLVFKQTATETPKLRLQSYFNYPKTNYTQSFWFKTTTPYNIFYHVMMPYQNITHPQWQNNVIHSVSMNKGNIADQTRFMPDGGGIGVSSGKNYADGQWHMVAVSRHPTEGGKLYIDGQLVASKVSSNNLPEGSEYISFGGPDYGLPYFQGTLDDVRLYKRVLSVAEIQKLYNGDQNTELIPIVYPEPTLTGIEESALAAESFNIYPNPTRDKVTIERLANGSEELAVKLVNMQGKTVLTTLVNANELSKNISISNLPKGLYVVRVQGKGQAKLMKLAIVD